MGDFTISDELKRAFAENGVQYISVKRAKPFEFYMAICRAKKQHEYGAFVTAHSPKEYKDMRLYLTTDKQAGFALTQDGNIVSVFNVSICKGVLKTLLPIAIENGGCKLDNFNSPKLSALYELYGFDPVSKTEFDKQFAPVDWNYERDGEPDIVFWIHNGDSASDVVFNFGAYDVDWSKIRAFSSYEEAEAFRDGLLRSPYPQRSLDQ